MNFSHDTSRFVAAFFLAFAALAAKLEGPGAVLGVFGGVLAGSLYALRVLSWTADDGPEIDE